MSPILPASKSINVSYIPNLNKITAMLAPVFSYTQSLVHSVDCAWTCPIFESIPAMHYNTGVVEIAILHEAEPSAVLVYRDQTSKYHYTLYSASPSVL